MQADLLHKLNQRIALDIELLKEQKARIEELEREGHETADAEAILDALEGALEVDIAERETALSAIEVQYLTSDKVPPLSDTDGPFGGIPAGARRFLDVFASSSLSSSSGRGDQSAAPHPVYRAGAFTS